MNEEESKTPEPQEDTTQLNEKIVKNLLIKLSGTIYWDAIRWYLNGRKGLAESSLYSIDPFKEPTLMARNQGVRMGLNDLIDFVLLAKEREFNKNDDK